MLLRSITEHIKQQNWFAVCLDFVIVVVGVFVGLQAQEWSADRADRSAERAAIERLVVEYERNLDLLEADKEKSQKAVAATERLLAMMTPASGPVAAQVLIEWQEIERNHGEELIFGLTTEYIAWPSLLSEIDESWQPSALESDLQGLFSSKRFEGLLTNRRDNTRQAIVRIEALKADTGMLVDRLKARLAVLANH